MRPLSRRAQWALQIILLLLVVAGVHAWQTRDLLPADRRTPAPELNLKDLGGTAWSSAQLAGRPAVVYFFAPWCGVCAASAPQLRAFHRWRGDDVQLLLVGLDAKDVDELRRYSSRHGLDQVPVLIGEPVTGAEWRVPGYPTYYVLDSEGRVAARDFGFTTAPGLWWRTLFL
jgi:thiol-disulfide isomerase/thioredoxin